MEIDAPPPVADGRIVQHFRRHIMVSVDRVERNGELRRNEVQIVVGQVATAKYEVHPPEPRSRGRCVHGFVDDITESEDVHGFSLASLDSIALK